MKTRVLALFLAAAACTTPPELLPPPFGPSGPSNTRLFFPTGLARLPDGSLLVANGNFNHAFDGGTIVTVRKSYLDAFFAKKLSCQSVIPPEQALSPAASPCDDDVSNRGDVFGGAVMIGNYAGPLALNDDSTMAFTGSRDTSLLNAVSVNADLTLSCAPGSGTAPDCRKGVLDLGASGVLAPYAVVPGDFTPPGGAPRRVVYVAAQTPRIDAISSGSLSTSSVVAAVDMANPSKLLFTMLSSSEFVASGAAVGPMLFDSSRRELIMAGCFARFSGSGAGEPGTGRCNGISNNWLRTLAVDAQAGALVQVFDLFGDVLSIETTALALAAPDPVSHVPTRLWATMRNPDILVEVELPAEPSVAPRVRHVTSLPISPADLLRIPRGPGKADLLAVIAERSGTVAFYDTGLHQILGQLENLGDSPFTLALLGSDGVTAQIAATVFRACRIALLEVPLDAPWQAELRGRVGRCK